MVIQLPIALMTIMEDQVEQLNKTATTIGIDEEAAKNKNFEIVCQIGLTDPHDSHGS